MSLLFRVILIGKSVILIDPTASVMPGPMMQPPPTSIVPKPSTKVLTTQVPMTQPLPTIVPAATAPVPTMVIPPKP
jgi:hypothetical protein